jgi:hypothetical protein
VSTIAAVSWDRAFLEKAVGAVVDHVALAGRAAASSSLLTPDLPLDLRW